MLCGIGVLSMKPCHSSRLSLYLARCGCVFLHGCSGSLILRWPRIDPAAGSARPILSSTKYILSSPIRFAGALSPPSTFVCWRAIHSVNLLRSSLCLLKNKHDTSHTPSATTSSCTQKASCRLFCGPLAVEVAFHGICLNVL